MALTKKVPFGAIPLMTGSGKGLRMRTGNMQVGG